MIHGGIDGFSRMIVYLNCSVDNKAQTVLSYFLNAVAEFDLPSRVCSDKGGENVDVAWYMLNHPNRQVKVCITSELKDYGETCLLVELICSIIYSIPWRIGVS